MLGLGKRTFTVLLMTTAVLAVSAAVVYAGNRGGDHPKAPAKHHGGKHHRHHGNASRHRAKWHADDGQLYLRHRLRTARQLHASIRIRGHT